MAESGKTVDMRNMTELLVQDAEKLDSTGEDAMEAIQHLETDIETLRRIYEGWKSGDPFDTDELLTALKSATEFSDDMMRAVKKVATDAENLVDSATKMDDTVKEMPKKDLVQAMAFDAYDQFTISSVRKRRFMTLEAYEKQQKIATNKKVLASDKKIEWSELNQRESETQSVLDAMEEEIEELNQDSERHANLASQTKQRADTLTLILETLEAAQEEKERIDKEQKSVADEYSEDFFNKVDEVYKTSVKFDKLLAECLDVVEEVDQYAGIKPKQQ